MEETATTFDVFKLLDVDVRNLPKDYFEKDEQDSNDVHTVYGYNRPIVVLSMFGKLTHTVGRKINYEEYKMAGSLTKDEVNSRLTQFIDAVAKAFGPDDNGRGAFDYSEVDEIYGSRWKGRMWSKTDQTVQIIQRYEWDEIEIVLGQVLK